VIRLNPSKFQLYEWNLFSYHLYIICESGEVAADIQKLEMKDEKFEKLLGHPRVKKDAFKNKDGIDSEEA
jgi:hypothetical protein